MLGCNVTYIQPTANVVATFSISWAEPRMQTPGYVIETIADRTVGCDRDDRNKLLISYDNLLG